MHLELPSESSLVTFHANEMIDALNEEADVGHSSDKDYSPFMTVELDDIAWLVFKDLTKGYRG